ncbi:MAG: hypothetical protein R3190_04180 [Thermoanaerobaculia bacterium]|nr:hypothetical protein [Thermoanaerobaculia bacterium]
MSVDSKSSEVGRERVLRALRLLEEVRDCYPGDITAHDLVEQLRQRLRPRVAPDVPQVLVNP